jgi:hypothetical protein
MVKCKTCGQPLPNQENPITVALESKPPREFEEDLDPEWFNMKCYLLLRHPNVTEEFKTALMDLPKALRRWGKLTKGQYKFFCVIHQKLTTTWPSRPKPGEIEEPIPFEPDPAPF